MTLLKTENLKKSYGRRTGVVNLSLELGEGDLFGFLGPNGAGKTTAIRVLLGFLRPTAGRASIFGWDCWQKSRLIKSEVGYLPGELRLYPWLTVRLALEIGGRARRRNLLEPGTKLADTFELEMDLPVQRMSRGTRQKLGLLMALAHRPRLLILDEPATGLDPLMQQALFQHLRQLAADGHTVLFSSHTLSEVEKLCDRVGILREGRLVADERLDVLRARAQRSVSVTWRGDAPVAGRIVPPFLHVHERTDRIWRGTWSGAPLEFARWCADKPLDDMSIGEPDLASLFREYYRGAKVDP